MNETKIKNNKVTLSGEIVSNFAFDHECYGEGFYIAMLAIERLSGQKDIIPIMVSEKLVDISKDWTGEFFQAVGEFRSYNKHEDEKSKLELFVFVKYIEILTENKSVNNIFLDGYISKPPIYRKTPLGREIADILLAVNRPYGKSDYIPMVCWGRNAKSVSKLSVGDRLKIDGRIQSRTYIKRISEEETEERTAFEVSVCKVKISEN